MVRSPLPTVLFVLCVLPAAAGAQEDQQKAAQMAAWKAISSSAGAIDACTAAYIVEYPAGDGQAKVTATIGKDGAVMQATVATSLDGARNLRPCLERVAKGWKFPPINTEKEDMTLTVIVKKGVKFVLRKPGEQPKPAAPNQPQQEETVIDFLPSTWSESPK